MPPQGLVLAGVFGLMVGSFLNVCIARIPSGESVVRPRSRCPRCRCLIAWFDNVPIVSYIVLGGRCRRCREPIGLKYPLVEAATALAFVGQAWFAGPDLSALAVRLVFTAALIVLFMTDLETMRLPDVVTLPGIAVGVASSTILPPGIIESVAGAVVGAAIPWGIRWVWFRWRGVEAMGLGDVKMLAMIGAWLGWQQVWVVLFLSSLAGAAVGLSLTAGRRRTLAARLPFGTFLAASAYLASLVGEELLSWYLGLY
jgi:leader peptidase (prepilin peptidase)/N-methyltransferase